MGRQPGGQVGRALEVEQGVGEGFQLLQREGLDPGGGGFAQGAAEAVEWRRAIEAASSRRPS
jgi:hypothetical protein